MRPVPAFRALAAAFAASALAAACAFNPPAPPADAAARQMPDAFSLSGRLSVTDGTRSANGRLDWQRSAGPLDRWTVSSPLGQIVAQAVSAPDGAEVVLASGERQFAPKIADLIPMLLPGALEAGLPPERLAAWIIAFPLAGAEVRALDPIGRPARIVDQGWIIDYLSYRDDAPGSLPRLIDVSRIDFRLRLVIDRWETDAP